MERIVHGTWRHCIASSASFRHSHRGRFCRPRPTPESFILSLAPSRLRKDIGDRRLRLVALVLSQALKDAAQFTRRTVVF